MKTALLIADLEGVAGVDRLEALAFGGAHHAEACARMTDEVNAAIAGLAGQGFTHVRVSDSHRSGSGAPNLAPGQLPDVAELRYVDPDMYGGALLDGVDAICCVGMHAAGGTPGFAAHTVELHAEWRVDGRRVSETELAIWLAAERGVPAIFASGDDVLGAAVAGLVPFVQTKIARGVGDARSASGVLAALTKAAGGKPAPIAKVSGGPLRLRFRDGAQATFDGGTFAHRYHQALRALAAVEVEVPQVPGTRGFAKWAAQQIREAARAFEGR